MRGRQHASPSWPLAPAMTTPAPCRTVAERCSTPHAAQPERSPILDRPVTLHVVFGLALLGLAGSFTVIQVVVRAASTHCRPPDQLAVPAFAHHPADAGADQHPDQRADPG